MTKLTKKEKECLRWCASRLVRGHQFGICNLIYDYQNDEGVRLINKLKDFYGEDSAGSYWRDFSDESREARIFDVLTFLHVQTIEGE